MKKPAILLAALGLAALPLALSPAAGADVCGSATGPAGEVTADACVPPGAVAEGAGILGSIAVADALDDWHQRMAGRPPCFTPEGVPYYTPGNSPCL